MVIYKLEALVVRARLCKVYVKVWFMKEVVVSYFFFLAPTQPESLVVEGAILELAGV